MQETTTRNNNTMDGSGFELRIYSKTIDSTFEKWRTESLYYFPSHKKCDKFDPISSAHRM